MNTEALQATLPIKLLHIAQEIRAQGGTSYLVGGWVRDAVLGVDSRDYDIEVYGIEQDALLELLSKHGRPNLVGKSYGVIHLMSKGIGFDFSFPRLESKVGVGHRAFTVETHKDLDFFTAALRRDFTINAMGMELPELTLNDPHGGLRDLAAKVLRHVGPAFAEDSLRVLRAVQFAARFKLTVDPLTVELCKSLDLRELSRERIYEEFRKWLLKSAQPSFGLQAFLQMDLTRFFPWLKPIPHTEWKGLARLLDEAAKVCEGTEIERATLMFAILGTGCDSEKDLSEFLQFLTPEIVLLRKSPAIWRESSVLERGLLSGDAMHAPWLRRLALRVDLQQAFRFVNAMLNSREESIDALNAAKQFAQALEIWDAPPEPFLTGKMLMGLGLTPGKFFGEWIAECFELQLDGNCNSSDEALHWAQEKLKTN